MNWSVFKFIMNQYIDVKRIADTLYLEDQTKLVIEFLVHSDQLSIIEPGGNQNMHTFLYFQYSKNSLCIIHRIWNDYISFSRIRRDKSWKNGILYVSMINTSLESRTIPRGIQLGVISIRKYSSFEYEVEKYRMSAEIFRISAKK